MLRASVYVSIRNVMTNQKKATKLLYEKTVHRKLSITSVRLFVYRACAYERLLEANLD